MVGLGLLDLTIWYFILNTVFRSLPEAERIGQITANMLTFGMGASSMALFARVGGGIFTKAADVGPIWLARWRPEFRKMIRAIPRLSRIMWVTMWRCGRYGGLICMNRYVGSIVSTSALAVAAGFRRKGRGLFP